MIEIIFLGRGGQGAKSAAILLTEALFIENPGMLALQASSEYGPERGGAPTKAFVRVDLANKGKRIRKRGPVSSASFVIILDPTLEAKLDGADYVLINTGKEARVDGNFFAVDGYEIAHDCGLAGNVNTVLLGAFAKTGRLVSLESVLSAIEKKLNKKIEENKKAATFGFEKVRGFSDE